MSAFPPLGQDRGCGHGFAAVTMVTVEVFGLVVAAVADKEAIADALVTVRANAVWEVEHTYRS